MINIKIEIEYDGTEFSGWEIQSGRRTVRGEIEALFKEYLHETVKLIGASRTDAGVHAICQVANFKLVRAQNFDLSKIKGILQRLPRDIYVKNVTEVPVEFDARKSAKSKVYLYKLLLGRSPLLRKWVWEYRFQLDIKKIESALPLFLGVHRFDLFSHKDSGECEIKRFELISSYVEGIHELPLYVFEIEANRFLHRMVRMMVGTLAELGRGKIGLEDIEQSLNLNSLTTNPYLLLPKICAPPQGLYLKEVKYD